MEAAHAGVPAYAPKDCPDTDSHYCTPCQLCGGMHHWFGVDGFCTECGVESIFHEDYTRELRRMITGRRD